MEDTKIAVLILQMQDRAIRLINDEEGLTSDERLAQIKHIEGGNESIQALHLAFEQAFPFQGSDFFANILLDVHLERDLDADNLLIL